MMPASVGATVFLLAALFAGKTPVMVNWTTGTRTLRHSLDRSASRPSSPPGHWSRSWDPRASTCRTSKTRSSSSKTCWRLEAGGEDPGGAASRISWAALERATPPETAVVLFTSGSESLPKAVPLTHRNILANIRDMSRRGEAQRRDRMSAYCRRSIPSA